MNKQAELVDIIRVMLVRIRPRAEDGHLSQEEIDHLISAGRLIKPLMSGKNQPAGEL